MARRSAVLAILLLAPALAAAQATPGSGAITIVESADPSEINDPQINKNECNGTTADTLTYFWNPSVTGSSYEIWLADQPSSMSSTCPPTSSSTTTVHSVRIQSVQAGTTNFKDQQTVQARLSSISVSCDGTVSNAYLCMNVAGKTDQIAATGSLSLDLALPPIPTDVHITPGDTVLHVSWNEGSSGGSGSTSGYRVFWGPANGDLNSSHELTGAGTTSYDITGLTDGSNYDVQVAALTKGKNEGTRSERVGGTPVVVNDFWRLYRNDGGREEGGCASGEAGLAAILVMLPLALRRRRP